MDFVEIVGTASNGIETYDKIINLKPEVVFAKYYFNNMTGLELMKKSKEKLQNNIPIFNMIVDDISNEEIREAMNIIGDKPLVRKPYKERAVDILKDYRDYSNK